MYSQEDFKNWLFIDIETVSNTENLDAYSAKLGQDMLIHWENKCSYIRQDENDNTLTTQSLYKSHAALYPEFGKIIVISVGQVKFENGAPIPKVRSIYGNDEQIILVEFMEMMQKIFAANINAKLVGHNINRFDIPYILKRAVINGLSIPSKLHLQKLKPWETCLLDTTDVWKFGNYSGGATLSLICDLLGIPTPKDNMQGSDTTDVYWQENRLNDIKDYCEKDVVATMNVMLKLSNLPIIE